MRIVENKLAPADFTSRLGNGLRLVRHHSRHLIHTLRLMHKAVLHVDVLHLRVDSVEPLNMLRPLIEHDWHYRHRHHLPIYVHILLGHLWGRYLVSTLMNVLLRIQLLLLLLLLNLRRLTQIDILGWWLIVRSLIILIFFCKDRNVTSRHPFEWYFLLWQHSDSFLEIFFSHLFLYLRGCSHLEFFYVELPTLKRNHLILLIELLWKSKMVTLAC